MKHTVGVVVASSASKVMCDRACSWERSPVRKTAGRAEERCREASWGCQAGRDSAFVTTDTFVQCVSSPEWRELEGRMEGRRRAWSADERAAALLSPASLQPHTALAQMGQSRRAVRD